jgi:hypothetical protein
MRCRATRSWIRYVGLAVFWLGLAYFFVGFGNWDKEKNFPENLLILSERLYLALAGAGVYVLARIPYPLVKQVKAVPDAPFDFNARFAPYIIYTPWVLRLAKWLLGAFIIILSMFAGLAFMAASEGLSGNRQPRTDEGRILVICILVVAIPTQMLLLMFGLRFCARRGEQSLRTDRRKPFLYLRSFVEDRSWLGDEGLLMRLLLLFRGGWYQNYERRLVLALGDVGPVVAIGKPSEKLPPFGAARIYIRNALDWQRVVSDLVGAARAVFLRIGQTPGFRWEVEHIVAKCEPRKIVFCLPPRDRERMYAYLRENFTGVFPKPLPARLGEAMFLTFRSDWEPVLLTNQHSHFFRRWIVSRAPEMRDALNPRLAELGVPLRDMPYVFREYLFMFVLIMMPLRCCIDVFKAGPVMMQSPSSYEP